MTTRPATLWQEVDFRRYFASRTLSLFGTVVTLIALPVLVYRLSDSAPLTALVSLLESLPYVIFGLFAGALSDRWDRRRVMVVTDVLDALVMASVPIAHVLGVLTITHLLVVAFVVPAIGVFFDGANFGALPVLVGRHQIAKANAVVWGASAVSESVLPSLVGLLLAVVNPATLLSIDALSYLASAGLIRAIARPLHDVGRLRERTTVRAVLTDIGVGVRFLIQHSGVRTMTIAGFVNCVSGGGFVALMVAWFDRVLDVGTSGWRFGVLWAAWSVGALLATILLPRLLDHVTAGWITLVSLPCAAVLGVATTYASTWQIAASGILAWSIAYTMVAINSISYRQQVTPEPLLGRVNTAGRMLAWGLGWTGGAGLSGLLSSLIGVTNSLHVVTCFTAVAALVAWLSPLRREPWRPGSADLDQSLDPHLDQAESEPDPRLRA